MSPLLTELSIAARLAVPRVALPLAIASMFFIVVPSTWLKWGALEHFRQSFLFEIGLCLLGSLSVLIAHGVFAVRRPILEAWKSFSNARRMAMELEARQRSLSSLRPDERALLLPYVKDKKTTCTFEIDDGIARSLVGRRVLVPASPTGDVLAFPFNMEPWAREYLEAHPELLEGAEPRPKRSWMAR